ncbi:MAG: hypothetical protein ACOVOX_09130 [Burkholderiaceae bacterium]
MSREDAPEDLDSHAEWRAQANNASGWNGSLKPYVHDTTPGTPCPRHLMLKLLALREAAAQREAGRVKA